MSLLPITATLLTTLSAGLESPVQQAVQATPEAALLAPSLAQPAFSGPSHLLTAWFEAGTTGVALELLQSGRTTRWRWIDPRAAEKAAEDADQEQAGKDKKKKKKAPKDAKSGQSSAAGSGSRWGSGGRDGAPNGRGSDTPPSEGETIPGNAGGGTPEQTAPPVIPVEELPEDEPEVEVIEGGGADPIVDEPPAPVDEDPEVDPEPEPEPDLPPPPAPEFTATLGADGLVTLTEVATGRKIISPNRMPLWTADTRVPADQSLQPTVTFQPKPNGFDVVYQFTNNTGSEKSLGDLRIGGIRFGEEIHWRKFEVDGKEIVLDHNGQNYFQGGSTYPFWCYSPVIIARENDIVLGASVCYDAPEYKHNVLLRMESPGGQYTEGGRNWQMLFQLNPPNAFSDRGNIHPGETRTYRVTLRAEKLKAGDHENEWMRTLVPYRDFFLAQYGGVHYERDPRPINVHEVSAPSTCSPSNPMGWNGFPEDRVNVAGWGLWADRISLSRERGFSRFELRGSGGMYLNNPQNNLPFQVSSTWSQFPLMISTLPVLESAVNSAPNGELGFWWGRCVQVMRTWDTPHLEVLDPANPEHVALGFAELDGMVAAGAKTIGLDSVSYQDVWDSYDWLSMMHARHPHVKFIIEPLGCDILHTLGGTYVYGTRVGVDDVYQLDGPVVLADFVNQGHELWAGIDDANIRRIENIPNGQPIPEEITRLYMRRFTDMGYVAYVQVDVTLTGTYNARESWLDTVPPDLILP